MKERTRTEPRAGKDRSRVADSDERPLVLVTGASGRLGTAIGVRLGRDHRLVGLDIDPTTDASLEECIECDFTSDDSVRAAFELVRERHGGHIASVIHLAAYYDFSGEPSPLYDELTVQGTRRLLQTLRDFEVEQLVFSSSLLVLQAAEGEAPLDEASPVEAEWDYPRSKLEAEDLLRQTHGEVPVVVLRIAGAYDADCRSIPIAQQMARIWERRFESYFFPGNASHGQPFVHFDDVARCVEAVVVRRDRLGTYETFLVAEEDVVSYAELQELLGEGLHGNAWPTIRIPAPVAKAGAWLEDKAPGRDPFIKPWMIDLADAHFPVTTRRARQLLDWTSRRGLRETLPEMARRLVEDPRRWYEINGLEAPDDVGRGEATRSEHAAR